MDRSVRNDAIAAVIMLVVVAVFAPLTAKIFVDPRDPGFGSRDFPIMVLGTMAVLALALGLGAVARLVRSGWRLHEAGEADSLLRYLVPILALGFLYVWLLELFQYALPTFVALAASLAIFGNRGVVRLLVIPLAVTGLFYLLFFGVFGLHEPPGTILNYESDWFFRPLRKMLGLA